MNKFLPLAILMVVLVACSANNKNENSSNTDKTPKASDNSTAEEVLFIPVNQPQKVDPARLTQSPLEAIKELDRKIDTYKSGPNLSAEDLESNRKLKQEVIRGTFDIAELSKRAMSVNWEPLTEKQRADFIQLMTSLLEKKAILSKEQVRGSDKPYKIVYRSEEFLDAEKKNAQVSTKLFVPAEKIDLDINYKLAFTEKGWNIYDVIVDNASLVENYKFQFDTIIKKNGFAELISRMEKKLNEME